MTRNAITTQDRAIAEADRKAGNADERNFNTLLDILTLPRCGCNGHPSCPQCGWM